MSRKVLLIDDDPDLLAGLRRQLRKKFDISIAEGGAQALEIVAAEGPFAVVVCDMQMPKMDGLQVLLALQETAPDTQRIMLTGNADQQTAVEAINAGNILRFYTKPCDTENLVAGINAGIKQFKLINAERDLLEKTLAGSIKVLFDVLALADPEAFKNATRMKELAVEVCKKLRWEVSWQLNIAAMLWPIGLLTIPEPLRDKAKKKDGLTASEIEVIKEVPKISRDLIANIPRLESVAEIVYYKDKGFDGSGFPEDNVARQEIPREARILKILNDLINTADGRILSLAVLQELKPNRKLYDPDIFSVMELLLKVQSNEISVDSEVLELPLSMLRSGYYLLSDIVTDGDHLILAAGWKLNDALVARLRNLSKIEKIREPIRVSKSKPPG